MTEHANPTSQKIQALFKTLVWDNLVRGLLAFIFAKAPFLAWWPLKQLIEGIVTSLLDKFYEEFRMVVDLQTIAWVNDSHRKDFDRAASALLILEREHGAESQEYLNARENAKSTLSQYVRFRGV